MEPLATGVVVSQSELGLTVMQQSGDPSAVIASDGMLMTGRLMTIMFTGCLGV